MRFSKINLLSLPYIIMGLVILLFNVVFTIGYIETGKIFMLGVYLIDFIFLLYYSPLTKIYITSDSIIEKGLVFKKQIFFHEIKQLSLVQMQRSSKFIKNNEITSPSVAIFQICVLKRRLLDPPVGDPNISISDYIQFDYRPKAYEFLLNAIA